MCTSTHINIDCGAPHLSAENNTADQVAQDEYRADTGGNHHCRYQYLMESENYLEADAYPIVTNMCKVLMSNHW